MATRDPRVALLCIDPIRHRGGDFMPFNYSIRKVEAAVVANPSLDADVRVFDYETTDVEDIVAEVEEMDPDIVGASAYVWSFPVFYEVARALKRARPDRVIVFGGPSARTEMFDLPPFHDGPQFVDALVIGEGENGFEDIVGLTERTRDQLRNVPGIAVSTGDGWFTTAPRTLPVPDSLPSPFQMGLVSHVRTGHLETFRGCPLSCTFCQWGGLTKSNRVFSVDYLVKELSSYVSMGLRSVYMVDPALNLNGQAFRNLCEADREVGFFKTAFLRAEIYPQYLNDEHMDFLRKVGGGLNLGLGLQSFNKGVLGNVERPFDEARFDRVVGELVQVAPRAEIEIIMGLPGDNPESFRQTLHHALSLGTGVRAFHCLVLPDALMSRSPESFELEYDPIDLSMISCLGWKDGAIQRMSEELHSLTQSIPGASVHSDGFGWYFPSQEERTLTAQECSPYFVTGEGGETNGDNGSTTIPDESADYVPLEVAAPRGVESETTSAPYDSPARISVDPALHDALSDAVNRATVGAWELVEIDLAEGLLILRVVTPSGELDLDIRPAVEGANAFRIVEGVAYSYRSTARNMPAGALKQFESIIERLKSVTPTVLGTSASAGVVDRSPEPPALP